jgi:hypothetical protein
MANPVFDGTALTTDAPAERIGSPGARIRTERMPGVKGEFVQTNHFAGRDIIVTGVYRGPPAALTLDAQAALKGSLRTVQARVADGVGAYVGVDGHTYPACVLKSYRPVGGTQYVRIAGNYQALIRVEAAIRDLDP